LNRNDIPPFGRLINFIVKYNFPFIVISALLLCFFEIIEPIIKHESLTDGFHISELLFFLLLLALVRKLINYLIEVNTAQGRTLEIMKFKHDVSQKLAIPENWDSAKNELVRLLGELEGVFATRFQLYNPLSNKLEEETIWSAKSPSVINFSQDCQQCVAKHSVSGLSSGIHVCGEQDNSLEYCFPIAYGNSLFALLQIKLEAGALLSPKQIDNLESIVPEISLALMASQKQEALREMESTQTALAERREISTVIHDQLGQNLGFLHLKLDQLVDNEVVQKDQVVQTDVKRLRDIANEAYGIVRDILKATRSDTTPNITNLLQEQARSISRRAGFKLDFQSNGKPIPLPPVVQQSVFFTFCEILNNVEKHANAGKVTVLVTWNDGILDVSVTDDGNGFEPEHVLGKNRFGLQIMRERISGIKGSLMINSSYKEGTIVSMSVPLKSATVKP